MINCKNYELSQTICETQFLEHNKEIVTVVTDENSGEQQNKINVN